MTQRWVMAHFLTNIPSGDSSKEVGRGGQGELWLKLEDKLELNLFKMRWSSLLLELLRKDRSVCAYASVCCSACVCMATAVKKGQHSKHCGWWGAISLCFLLWDIINCSISSALCNLVLCLCLCCNFSTFGPIVAFWIPFCQNLSFSPSLSPRCILS